MAKGNRKKVTLDKCTRKKVRIDQDLNCFGKIGDIVWIFYGHEP